MPVSVGPLAGESLPVPESQCAAEATPQPVRAAGPPPLFPAGSVPGAGRLRPHPGDAIRAFNSRIADARERNEWAVGWKRC